MSLLQVQKLTIAYDGKRVVDELDFELGAGESLGIVGESGSGKSQTALALFGLLAPSASVSGDIRLDGRSLLGLSETEMNAVRARRLAMVFQDPAQALNPYVRIGVQLGRILLEHGLTDKAGARRRVLDMLGRVGLPEPERQYRSWPHELSGGMRQRAMIAAALLTEPDILVADEPTTALDVTVQAQILALLEEVRDRTALLLITHDLSVVASHCERTLILSQGRKIEEGPTRRIFTSPADPHTRRLVDAAPRLGAGTPPEPLETEPLLAVRNMSVRYGDLRAVQAGQFVLGRGETLAIVGESGSGKSSLMRAVLGLVRPQTGDIDFSGRDGGRRGGISMVFQDPAGSLNPQMRVRDIVAEPLRARRGRNIALHVASALERVELGDEFADRYPHQLSGGQAQRVAIARALITEPDVLVCDEAVAALDGRVREQILGLLKSVQQETGLAIVFISHDLAVVEGLSHRTMVMYLGRVVEMASSRALFGRPLHPYTRGLLESVPDPDPLKARRPTLMKGEAGPGQQPDIGCPFHPRCAAAVARCRVERPMLRPFDTAQVACHRAEELQLSESVPAGAGPSAGRSS